jgi:branched-chain amino acid transport system ATP-binding protein
MTAAPVLRIEGLTKSFGGVTAADGVSFAVGGAEIRGLIGPNGAGKTTLINLIAGLESPDRGDVRLRDRSLRRMRPHARARLGLLRTFQVPNLFGNMTVAENLMLPYEAQGRRDRAWARNQSRELLELTGLGPLRAEPAKHLSGGQQALLQLACGFMVEDLSCYLLDEPFAGINPVLKDTMLELVEHYNRMREIAFLVVSHDMAVVRALCPEVTVLVAGRVVLEGTVEHVLQDRAVIDAYLGRAWT